jgi:hypothetical protein
MAGYGQVLQPRICVSVYLKNGWVGDFGEGAALPKPFPEQAAHRRSLGRAGRAARRAGRLQLQRRTRWM